MEMEYVRNLHSNYLRVQLAEKPEENRYQYCILSRGGIRGLLNSELRYLDDKAYLYYDITSKQNIAQLYTGQTLKREWVCSFFKAIGRLQKELERFLLDEKGCLWNPGNIFQDLERNLFFFLFVPYCDRESQFHQLLEFILAHLDYEDDKLVECIYGVSEKYMQMGDTYLREQIFRDVDELERDAKGAAGSAISLAEKGESKESPRTVNANLSTEAVEQEEKEKTGIRGLFDGKRKRDKTERVGNAEGVREMMKEKIVAEQMNYMGQQVLPAREPRYGATIYMEENVNREPSHRLYTLDGLLDVLLPKQDVILGKKRSTADIVVEEPSVSRVHAKIIYDGDYYLEDMNSTNGTFRNGLRMLPYEKCRLEPGDEIRLGQYLMIFR